jgi:hypothetical protein
MRSDIARVRLHVKLLRHYRAWVLRDAVTGQAVPVQLDQPLPSVYRDNQTTRHHYVDLRFLARNVPALGYRTYRIVPADAPLDAPDAGAFLGAEPDAIGAGTLTSPHYSVQLDAATGALLSWYDHALAAELVNRRSPHLFGQYRHAIGGWTRERPSHYADADRYYRDATLASTTLDSLEVSRCGPLSVGVRVHGQAAGLAEIEQEVILYRDLQRIDLRMRVTKRRVDAPESVYFVFPVQLPGATVRLEGPGYFMEPERDQLPGSSRDHYAIQNWVDVSTGGDVPRGIIWTSRDAPLVQFGEVQANRWLRHLRLVEPTIFSWVMNNYWRCGNFPMAQSGEALFRYNLTSYAGAFDPHRATCFGWERRHPLLTHVIETPQDGLLDGSRGQSVAVTAAGSADQGRAGAILTSFKRASAGDGFIARLYEHRGVGGAVEIRIAAGPAISRAYRTTPGERDLEPLAVHNGTLRLDLSAHDITTIRLVC